LLAAPSQFVRLQVEQMNSVTGGVGYGQLLLKAVRSLEMMVVAWMRSSLIFWIELASAGSQHVAEG
jgi:hypothetical protein